MTRRRERFRPHRPLVPQDAAAQQDDAAQVQPLHSQPPPRPMHAAASSTAAVGHQHPAEPATFVPAAEDVIDAAAASQPVATAAERIREAFVQPGVMLDGQLAMIGEASGASAAHDHIASGVAGALAAQQVPAALAALCAAAFPGVIGIRLAIRVAPRVLAVTGSFMAAGVVRRPTAGPLTVALAPDHGSASGACLRTALPQLDEHCTHGRRSPPLQQPAQCIGRCPCSVHVPCVPAAQQPDATPAAGAAASGGPVQRLTGGGAGSSGTTELLPAAANPALRVATPGWPPAIGHAASAGALHSAAAGGGSSAAGQGVGSCVILDFHCHLLPSLMQHVPAMASLASALQAHWQDSAAAYLPQHLLSPLPMPPPPSLAAATAAAAPTAVPDGGSGDTLQAQQQLLNAFAAGGGGAALGSGGSSSDQGVRPGSGRTSSGGSGGGSGGRRQLPPPAQLRGVRPRRE